MRRSQERVRFKLSSDLLYKLASIFFSGLFPSSWEPFKFNGETFSLPSTFITSCVPPSYPTRGDPMVSLKKEELPVFFFFFVPIHPSLLKLCRMFPPKLWHYAWPFLFSLCHLPASFFRLLYPVFLPKLSRYSLAIRTFPRFPASRDNSRLLLQRAKWRSKHLVLCRRLCVPNLC